MVVYVGTVSFCCGLFNQIAMQQVPKLQQPFCFPLYDYNLYDIVVVVVVVVVVVWMFGMNWNTATTKRTKCVVEVFIK